jgi:hypothetical protein
MRSSKPTLALLGKSQREETPQKKPACAGFEKHKTICLNLKQMK